MVGVAAEAALVEQIRAHDGDVVDRAAAHQARAYRSRQRVELAQRILGDEIGIFEPRDLERRAPEVAAIAVADDGSEAVTQLWHRCGGYHSKAHPAMVNAVCDLADPCLRHIIIDSH